MGYLSQDAQAIVSAAVTAAEANTSGEIVPVLADRSDEVFELGRPVLGVCLGMQALVAMFGGWVDRVPPAHGEVAQVEHDGTGLFAGLPQGFDAVRYHSLAATVVPEALRVTATSGGVVMGVVHRSLPLHGVQFHPESILTEHGVPLVANFLGLA